MKDEITTGEERERIVAELDLCQEHLNTSYMSTWQSGSIILAGALASLALTLQIKATNLAAAVITTVFAMGAVLILGMWLLFLQRETAFQRILVRRLRTLERHLGMRRALLIRVLDDLTEKPGTEIFGEPAVGGG